MKMQEMAIDLNNILRVNLYIQFCYYFKIVSLWTALLQIVLLIWIKTYVNLANFALISSKKNFDGK